MSGSTKRQDDVLTALVVKKRVTPEHLERARRLAGAGGGQHSVTHHLVQTGGLSAADLLPELGELFRTETVDIGPAVIAEETIALVPRELLLKHRVFPLEVRGRRLVMAMADPTDLEAIDALKFTTGLPITPAVTDEYSLEQRLKAQFQTGADINAVLEELTSRQDGSTGEILEQQDLAAVAMQEEIDAAPVVKFINAILTDAANRGASDIHIEFFETAARVRFRIDGALVTVAEPPRTWERAITTRLKVLGRMNTADRRLPLDGRIAFKLSNRTIDFRVSTLPTQHGENVVLRLLDKTAITLDLDSLGFPEADKEVLMETIASPYGILLVTGPTGSGKTTTLSTILSLLNVPDQKVLTVEDPVEYDQYGISQVQAKEDIGLTFAATLRAFLRQDPDVIMVGEIRDQETGEIAMRAALTGHFVLSTLHTNSAAEAVTRLRDMGIEPMNVAAATSLIIAQRLVRQVCGECRIPDPYPAKVLRSVGVSDEEAARLVRGAGCRKCHGTGYRGRVGVYELLRVTDEIEDLIVAGRREREIERQAIAAGMTPMRVAGVRRALAQQTTLEEVIRKTPA